MHVDWNKKRRLCDLEPTQHPLTGVIYGDLHNQLRQIANKFKDYNYPDLAQEAFDISDRVTDLWRAVLAREQAERNEDPSEKGR